MEYLAVGSPEASLSAEEVEGHLQQLLARVGVARRVLLIPPDYTRAHSYAGEITRMLYRALMPHAFVRILPALGTHSPMTRAQISAMFPGIPQDAFEVHDWREGVQQIGGVPAAFIEQQSEGRLHYGITCEVNRLLLRNWDQIISIGQLVPHEVIGIANHSKNIFTGVGGEDTINKSHYLGAVYGMERIMGRADTPVRAVFNYMSEHFTRDLPITYVLTVRSKDGRGELVTRGLFAGEDTACFERGAALVQQVNLDLIDGPLRKVVVYLNAHEFKSTWLGNKAIYRTRLAMADDGELIIVAPGVKEFGEDRCIDGLIRKYGYRGTPHTLDLVERNEDLRANLSAAAHLIHGSSEGRFRITYCTGGLLREEVEAVGFKFADVADALRHYNPSKLRDGFNTMPDGEEVFFVSNPALGLWALKSQFPEAVATAV